MVLLCPLVHFFPSNTTPTTAPPANDIIRTAARGQISTQVVRNATSADKLDMSIVSYQHAAHTFPTPPPP